MKQIQQRAIVLRTHALREADLVVTLLGETTGKIVALARSARRSKKRFMGGVDIFDCGNCTLTIPRGESTFYTLEHLHDRQAWQQLMSSIDRLAVASFCLELSDAIVADGDPEGGTLFRPLYYTLRALERAEAFQEQVTIGCYYILESLRKSGFNVVNELEDSDSCRWFRHMLAQNQPIVVGQ